MGKIKKLFTNVRIIILLICLVLAVFAINPNPWSEGVAIRSVAFNSSANLEGFTNPKASINPMSREIILSINNVPIKNVSDYYNYLSTLEVNRSVQIKTDQRLVKLTILPIYEYILLNETDNITYETTIEVEEIINDTTYIVEKKVNRTKLVNKTLRNITGPQDIGLTVFNAPTSNIRKGLDLQGGTRVLLQPEVKLAPDNMTILIDNMKQRLNVYGLSDIVVKEANDLPPPLGAGNQYILVEIAGANEEEVKDLISKQGKFEAKIGKDVIFVGGNNDIPYVCRTADCAGIDPQIGCRDFSDGSVCRFRFAIALSPSAAQTQADKTAGLALVTKDGEQYLNESLDLYLDDSKVDSLNIGSDLRGQPSTDISISGSDVGATREEAVTNALNSMKRLQTILITGSLPVKLDVVKTDAVSPVLGQEFTRNALIVGLFAILTVCLIVFLRYRILVIAVSMMITMVSEVVLLLGLASGIGWNLDLAAIAGIIIAAGTGVDDQIVITDEVRRGESEAAYNWRQKLKKAFFIIFAAYFTTIVAMTPLLFAGAGLLKGFAFTTIAGVSFGVFITRPAFAKIIEIFLKE